MFAAASSRSPASTALVVRDASVRQTEQRYAVGLRAWTTLQDQHAANRSITDVKPLGVQQPRPASLTVRVRVCAVGDLDRGEAMQVPTVPPIAVFNVDGEFLATDDTCTHERSSLADGYVDGDQVECSWHFAKFCLRTGAALSLPATRPLQTYTVLVDGDEVFVEVEDGRVIS